jgi:hypothetical protein
VLCRTSMVALLRDCNRCSMASLPFKGFFTVCQLSYM